MVAEARSRGICTKDAPMPKGDMGRWLHPDAVCVYEEYNGTHSGNFERYECPHCGVRFMVELPD